jgi:hypothetical protein
MADLNENMKGLMGKPGNNLRAMEHVKNAQQRLAVQQRQDVIQA